MEASNAADSFIRNHAGVSDHVPRKASFVRLRCFGRRRLSSSPKLPAISLMPSMMRFQVPPRADSLNHTPTRHVNNLLLKLIDGKAPLNCFEWGCDRLNERTPYHGE